MASTKAQMVAAAQAALDVANSLPDTVDNSGGTGTGSTPSTGSGSGSGTGSGGTTPVTGSGYTPVVPGIARNMRLASFDDFDGTSLDTGKWYCGGKPNSTNPKDGDQYSAAYSVNKDHPRFSELYSVKDGILTLKAVRDGDKWLGAQIAGCFPDFRSEFHIRRGYIEIRAALPDGNGPWPAGWMLNTGSVDKSQGDKGAVEIDIYEAYGFPHNFNPTVHDWFLNADGSVKDRQGQTGNIDTSPALLKDFNLFGMLLEAEKASLYFNNKLVWSDKLPTWTGDQHFFPLLSMMTGAPGWPIDPNVGSFEHKIDYIRLYEGAPA